MTTLAATMSVRDCALRRTPPVEDVEDCKDLTSLAWLHNMNICPVPSLPTPPASPKPVSATVKPKKQLPMLKIHLSEYAHFTCIVCVCFLVFFFLLIILWRVLEFSNHVFLRLDLDSGEVGKRKLTKTGK